MHCCAMQGRVDAMQLLLVSDMAGEIRRKLAEESVCEFITHSNYYLLLM